MTIRGRDEAERARRWEELQRSARAVHALPAGDDPDAEDAGSGGRHRVVAASLAAATGLGGAAATLVASAPLPVAASTASFDQSLLQLTNQDRASNGAAAVTWNTTLGSIADGLPFNCSGGVANGRTVDMIQRDYFDHPIPECGGQYADIMLAPNGINWTAWGENIAWESGGAQAPCDPSTPVPVQFECIYMNSPEHRANILNSSYTQFGSAFELAGSYQGSSNAWVNTEEFIHGSGGNGGGAPAPTPRPVPVRTPRPVPVPVPVRPPVPVPVPVVQAAPPPAPAPTPTPAPTPPPFVPASLAPTDGTASTPQPATAPPAPLLYTPQGLLSDSVEAVLEGHLLD
jgi:uncharacterized protein YkwD